MDHPPLPDQLQPYAVFFNRNDPMAIMQVDEAALGCLAALEREAAAMRQKYGSSASPIPRDERRQDLQLARLYVNSGLRTLELYAVHRVAVLMKIGRIRHTLCELFTGGSRA